jgi:hypothetical protein
MGNFKGICRPYEMPTDNNTTRLFLAQANTLYYLLIPKTKRSTSDMTTQPIDPATQPRQRLLYLHARTPSVFSEILGYTPIEPVKGYRVEIVATELEWPYNTVHDAIVDGWQIVQFPHLQAPYDDRDLDVVGYEFILQKMEVMP